MTTTTLMMMNDFFKVSHSIFVGVRWVFQSRMTKDCSSADQVGTCVNNPQSTWHALTQEAYRRFTPFPQIPARFHLQKAQQRCLFLGNWKLLSPVVSPFNPIASMLMYIEPYFHCATPWSRQHNYTPEADVQSVFWLVDNWKVESNPWISF